MELYGALKDPVVSEDRLDELHVESPADHWRGGGRWGGAFLLVRRLPWGWGGERRIMVLASSRRLVRLQTSLCSPGISGRRWLRRTSALRTSALPRDI